MHKSVLEKKLRTLALAQVEGIWSRQQKKHSILRAEFLKCVALGRSCNATCDMFLIGLCSMKAGYAHPSRNRWMDNPLTSINLATIFSSKIEFNAQPTYSYAVDHGSNPDKMF